MKVFAEGWFSLSLLFAFSMVLVLPAIALADSPPVLQVVTVKVQGDGSAYLAKLKDGIPMLKKAGASDVRVFRATVAGDNSGLIFVSIEYPNLEAFAKGATKIADDADWQKLVKKLEGTGRLLVGNSLLEDVTPK